VVIQAAAADGTGRRAIVGGAIVVVLAAALGTAGWLLTGCVVPYVDAGALEHWVLLRGVSNLAAWWLGSAVLLVAAHEAVGRWFHDARDWRDRFDRAALGYLSPVGLFAIVPLAVAMLATPFHRAAGPWLYLAFDLRWWLALAVGVLIGLALAGRARASTSPLARSHRWLGVSLVALLAAISLLSSPRLRFQSVLIGDEPKYLRYLENWYRGRGFDVSDLGPIAALPQGFQPNVSGNFVRAASAIASVTTDLVAEGRRALGGHAGRRPGPARSEGGWFVEGRRGGIYQVHNPGLSFLLFPGYLVDRAISRTQQWNAQFPTNLYATGLTVLAIYLTWAWAVFRLLTAYTTRPFVSWIVTGIVFLSVPVTAFAYQFYPEAPAGLAIALLASYIFFSRDARRLRAFAYGLVAGALPWLHLRFMPLAAGAWVAMVIVHRRERGQITSFTAGAAVPLLLLSVYYYHVTGSLMPWAMYALTQQDQIFSAARAWHDLPAFWLDRTWGLVAHSPVFLFALPGLWLAWRRNRALAVFIAFASLGIAIPAAGHGYTGAFTTPLRLVAAVVPLLALPMADAIRAFWRSSWVRAMLVLAAVISVQTGITYNVHLIKSEASLHAATIGGWLFPLLLPDFGASHRLANPLTTGWAIATAAMLFLPVAVRRRRDNGAAVGPAATLVAATTIIAFAAAASTAAAIGGRPFDPAFTLFAGDARDRLIHFRLTANSAIQWSTLRGKTDVVGAFPNPAETTTGLSLLPAHVRAGTPVQLAVDARRPGNRPGWGVAHVDFGDGSAAVSMAIEGSGHVDHTFAGRGEYTIRATVDLWGLPSRVLEQRVAIE
jgi:hypothetical protein